MFETWQDVVVTIVAGAAAATVVWRTLGTWTDSRPGRTGNPACDHCALLDATDSRARRPRA